MAEFLNEQEQVELIKQFWKKYGTASIVALVVLIVGLTGWQAWQKRQVDSLNAASVDYQYLLQEADAGEVVKVSKIAQELMGKYSKTPYAGMAALFLAEQDISNKNLVLADQHLTFAKDHLKKPLKDVATLRLARVKLAENQPQAALDLLNQSEYQSETQFSPLFFMIQGEAYLALQNKEKAKVAYQSALSALDKMKDLALTDDAETEASNAVNPADILRSSLQTQLNAISS